jgi:hypothetical protein
MRWLNDRKQSNYNSIVRREQKTMRILLSCGVLVSAFASLCSAQFVKCSTSTYSTIGHREQVTIRRVTFLEPAGKVGASVLVPDANAQVPGIVFSHSAILGSDGSTDLREFAWALARAGAASIILDGTIDWRIPNDDSERSPHLMACAGQWLLLHAKLDRERLAEAGPDRLWGGGDTPHCMSGEVPCWLGRLWLNFGQTSPAEFRNTESMLTREGQQSMAEFAARALHLKDVMPEWFLSAPVDILSKPAAPSPPATLLVPAAEPRQD